jgi:hypothetical protein
MGNSALDAPPSAPSVDPSVEPASPSALAHPVSASAVTATPTSAARRRPEIPLVCFAPVVTVHPFVVIRATPAQSHVTVARLRKLA